MAKIQPIYGFKGELERKNLAKQQVLQIRPIIESKLENDIVVVDLDGTLFNVKERWKASIGHAKPPSPKFWNVFLSSKYIHLDKPIGNTPFILHQIKKMGFDIVYLSGRREEMAEDTFKQLKNFNYPNGSVYLRTIGVSTFNFKIRVITHLKMDNFVVLSIGDSQEDFEVGQETKVPTILVNSNYAWSKYDKYDIYKTLKEHLSKEEKHNPFE